MSKRRLVGDDLENLPGAIHDLRTAAQAVEEGEFRNDKNSLEYVSDLRRLADKYEATLKILRKEGAVP